MVRRANSPLLFFAKTLQLVIDLGALALAYNLAYMLSFDWDLTELYFKRMVFSTPYVVALQYTLLTAFGVPRFEWRYVGLKEAQTIFTALLVAAFLSLIVRFISGAMLETVGYAMYALIPVRIILIDLALAGLALTGIRALRRLSVERADSERRRAKIQTKTERTLLVGAGEAGLTVAKEISVHPELGIVPVGFLDDDPNRQGRTIHGIRVLGGTDAIAEFSHKYAVDQVLVTIARASGDAVRRIVGACEAAGVAVKTIPALHELVAGQLQLSAIRDVAIDDLLRREPVELDTQAIAAFIQGKTVLITGAGGSIGAELCRQVSRFNPSALGLVERFETTLFEIERELRATLGGAALTPFVGDICDEHRMREIFSTFRPQVVIHAAAHKHVPLMELQPTEAVRNNVLGTKRIAELAAQNSASHFVMISTDKAVRPTSIMGASKRVAELLIQGMADLHPQTCFVSVRFGNVLGSNGSVIPIFKNQIAAGGPLTVTHPEMRRYFMTIPEASQLVLQAAAIGKGGEVFILDMGKPVRIVDLAHDMIRLSGLQPGRDIDIEFTGVRPGEKLFEEIATDDERATRTRHPKIFIGKVQTERWSRLESSLVDLETLVKNADHAGVRTELKTLVPELPGVAVASEAN